METLEDVKHLFSREKASAALVIPKGFGESVFRNESTTLTLYKNPRHFIGPQIAEGIVGGMAAMGNGFVGLFEEPLKRVQSFIDNEDERSADSVAAIASTFYTMGDAAPNLGAVTSIGVKLEEEKMDKEPWEFNMAAMCFPGLVAFSLMTLSLSLEYRFLFDRKNKVNHRIVTTPMRPSNILLQQRLYSMAFLMVMAAGTSLLGGIIWQIPPNGMFGVGVVAIALIMFITGINGTIFSMTNSLKAVSAMSSVVLMVLLALGGGFFPIEYYPSWAQAVAQKIPTGMANIALTRFLTDRDPGISFPVLYAYCGAFFALSIVVGRKRIV